LRIAECGMRNVPIADCGIRNEKRMPFSCLRPYSAIRNLQSEMRGAGELGSKGAEGRRQKAQSRWQEAGGRGQEGGERA
jgi:hypothetical protein